MAPARVSIVSDGGLSVDGAIAAVKHAGAGAVVVMLGCVRDHTQREGAVVDVNRLEYEAYAAMAEKVIGAIVDDVEREFAVRATVQHRTGALAVGDLAVVVAVSAPHRKDAFRACERVIDRLKEDAPIWKREHSPSGISWVGLGP